MMCCELSGISLASITSYRTCRQSMCYFQFTWSNGLWLDLKCQEQKTAILKSYRRQSRHFRALVLKSPNLQKMFCLMCQLPNTASFLSSNRRMQSNLQLNDIYGIALHDKAMKIPSSDEGGLA